MCSRDPKFVSASIDPRIASVGNSGARSRRKKNPVRCPSSDCRRTPPARRSIASARPRRRRPAQRLHQLVQPALAHRELRRAIGLGDRRVDPGRRSRPRPRTRRRAPPARRAGTGASARRGCETGRSSGARSPCRTGRFARSRRARLRRRTRRSPAPRARSAPPRGRHGAWCAAIHRRSAERTGTARAAAPSNRRSRVPRNGVSSERDVVASPEPIELLDCRDRRQPQSISDTDVGVTV